MEDSLKQMKEGTLTHDVKMQGIAEEVTRINNRLDTVDELKIMLSGLLKGKSSDGEPSNSSAAASSLPQEHLSPTSAELSNRFTNTQATPAANNWDELLTASKRVEIPTFDGTDPIGWILGWSNILTSILHLQPSRSVWR
ncbi:hypothetical protein L484_012688 [Morus notabilis]|uniref:Uncharacterized protein n=1 Tax=Morus notabilis TaxID=981085 RepID=W9QD25_9ROSA|nr:hypothetical protein L484_012688 [Morus notabilis]